MRAGDPAGTRVLVLVHAFRVGVRLWKPQLDAFSGWRIITPTLPGFDGKDLIEDIAIDAYARHVLAQLDELRIDRAVFGGASTGGHVIFAVLRQAVHRVAGIILADTRSTADSAEALGGRRRLPTDRPGIGPAGCGRGHGPEASRQNVAGQPPGGTIGRNYQDPFGRIGKG